MELGLTDKLKEFEGHCEFGTYLRSYGSNMYEFKKDRLNFWTQKRLPDENYKTYFIQIDRPQIGEQLDLFYDQNLDKDIYKVEHDE